MNLIGEHTDYTGGLALPCAIDRATAAAAARREDGRVGVWSREGGDAAAFDVRAPQRAGGWVDYVAGVVQALGEAGRAMGHRARELFQQLYTCEASAAKYAEVFCKADPRSGSPASVPSG